MGTLKDSVKGAFSKFARSRDCGRWVCFPQLLAAGFVFFMHGYLCYNGYMMLGMPEYAAGYEDAADPISKFLWTRGNAAPAPGTANNRNSLESPLATNGNTDATPNTERTPCLCVPFVWLYRMCVCLVRFTVGVSFVPIGGACWILTWVCLFLSFVYCISAPEEASAPPMDNMPPVVATATPVAQPALLAPSEVRVVYADPVSNPAQGSQGGLDKV